MDRHQDLILLYRGAEADLFVSKLGPWDVVVKQRIRKKYRNSQLDKRIRKERTVKEAVVLREARKTGARTPVVLSVDPSKHSIIMTRVRGIAARDSLDNLDIQATHNVFRELGRQVGLLHQGGIVHGDLTTSNIIITNGNIPSILDFGMSSHSFESEDRGVDIHLLRRSIATSHAVDAESCSRAVSLGYTRAMGQKEASSTFRKTAEIARRGRYFAIR